MGSVNMVSVDIDKYTDHTVKGTLRALADRMNLKLLLAMVGTEMAMYLLAAYKGVGTWYLPVAAAMLVFTLLSYVVTYGMKADRVLLIIMLVLMNFGFLVQQIEMGENQQIRQLLFKLLAAFLASAVTRIVYARVSEWLSWDSVILILMIAQVLICAGMFFFGKVVGNGAGQGTISLAGMTPFELVKAAYLFSAAGLLCRETGRKIRCFSKKLVIDREHLLVIQTAILSLGMIICSELGTLLVIYLSGLLLLLCFGKHRKMIRILSGLTVGAGGVFWAACTIILPHIAALETRFPGVLIKLIQRFGAALYPEHYMYTFGYQGTRALEAITMGGWLGVATERYRVALPEASNDFIFANLVQTCGLLVAMILLVFLIAFLKRGMDIADRCSSQYKKGIVTAITILITIEAIIHIGYNLALLPITGIPMYFVSQGFTAIVTGMIFVSILLVISGENAVETEDNHDEE